MCNMMILWGPAQAQQSTGMLYIEGLGPVFNSALEFLNKKKHLEYDLNRH